MSRSFSATIVAILMVLMLCFSSSAHEFDDYYYQQDEPETWKVLDLSPFNKSEKTHSGIKITEEDLVEDFLPYAFTAYYDSFDTSGTHFKECAIVINHAQYNNLNESG